MKYLILATERDRVVRVSETEPSFGRFLEVEDSVADAALDMIRDRKQPIMLNGELVSGLELRESGQRLTWNEDEAKFEVLPPPVPASVTKRQLRRALVISGISLEAIEGALESIDDETQRELALIDWADATLYERNHPLINQLGAGFSLSPEDINNLFRLAAQQ